MGTGSHSVRTFFRVMTDWHRWLALSGENRKTGKAVTGACNFIFLFLAISGLYLWWPNKWTRGIVRAIAWFRAGLSGKGRDSNWHYVIRLLVYGAADIDHSQCSGHFLSMGQQAGVPNGRQPVVASDRSAGIWRTEGRAANGVCRTQRNARRWASRQQAPLQLEGLDKMLGNIQKGAGAWKTISFQLPTVANKTVAFSVDASVGRSTAAQIDNYRR